MDVNRNANADPSLDYDAGSIALALFASKWHAKNSKYWDR